MPAHTPETLIPWLQKHKNWLNLKGLATKAEISHVSLRAYLSTAEDQKRTMPESVATKLEKVLREAYKELF